MTTSITSTIDTIRPRILELRDRVRHGGAAATTLTGLRALYKEAEDADLIGTAKNSRGQPLIAEPDAPEIEARWAAMREKLVPNTPVRFLHTLAVDCACNVLIEDEVLIFAATTPLSYAP